MNIKGNKDIDVIACNNLVRTVYQFERREHLFRLSVLIEWAWYYSPPRTVQQRVQVGINRPRNVLSDFRECIRVHNTIRT
jgi:hypothetical protein